MCLIKCYLKVEKYVILVEFDMWYDCVMEMGFFYCVSGFLVCFSYKVGEVFIENVLKKWRVVVVGVDGFVQVVVFDVEKMIVI